MADRILVMSRGAITGEFLREDATEELLVNASAVGHGVDKKSEEAVVEPPAPVEAK